MSTVPKAWSNASTAKITAAPLGNKTVARVDMSQEVAGAGLCPACKKPMDECIANGHKGLVCHSDRVFLPAADK